jgi:two-component system, cell cycle sensor histidine kinase and response regulator CckA
MKATSDAVYDYDLRTNTLDENLRHWGYEPSDVESGVEWWADRIHPDDRDATLISIDHAIDSGSGVFDSTYRFRRSDGRFSYVTDRAFVLCDAASKPIRLVGAMRDVDLYWQMFELNPQPMWAFHRESLRFLAVNQKAIQVYGYSREEFLSMSLTEIRPPEDVPLLMAHVSSPDREHEGRTIWRHFSKAGQLLQVEVRTQDIELDGAPARIALMTDVSRRLVVERQIRESQKLEAIGQLAGGIAHDFNNLISIIQGYSQQALAKVDSTHPLHHPLESIDAAANRAIALTRQLLTFAQQKSITPSPIRWSAWIHTVQPVLRKLLPPGIDLCFTTRTQTAQVLFDAGLLEQVLFNLITNARDAIGESGTIQVTSALVDLGEGHTDSRPGFAPGQYLQLTVADTGSGMSSEVLEQIFEPFFTTKQDGKGTGLGLSTVHGIVTQAQGLIRVDSTPGQGSEFRIYIPVHAAPPQSVLIAEDETDLRHLLKSAIEQAGYRVFDASSGQQAKSILAENPIDILLTDIVMPGVEGLDLLRHVKSAHPATHVVAISGAFDGQFLPVAESLGAAFTLHKPLDIAALVQRLSSLQ